MITQVYMAHVYYSVGGLYLTVDEAKARCEQESIEDGELIWDDVDIEAMEHCEQIEACDKNGNTTGLEVVCLEIGKSW